MFAPTRAVRARAGECALLCAIAGLLWLVTPGRAAAQAAQNQAANQAKMINQGIDRQQQGDRQGAYRAFLRAYNVRPTPKAAAHLGSCEFDIGLWVESEAHVTEALREASDPWINANRKALLAVLNNLRTVLGRLEVVGRPAGAEVEVSGRSVGRLPLERPLRVVKGQLVVRVTAAGYKPFQHTVNVTERGLAQVVVELDPAGPGAPAPASSLAPVVRRQGPGSDVAARDPGRPPGEAFDRSAGEADWRTPAAWTSAGLAALLATGGVAGALISNSNAKRFNAYTGAPNTSNRMCNQSAPDSGGGECPGWLSAAETSRALAIASGVGAGVAGIAAVIFFSTARETADPGRQARGRLLCAPGVRNEVRDVGATCLWRF